MAYVDGMVVGDFVEATEFDFVVDDDGTPVHQQVRGITISNDGRYVVVVCGTGDPASLLVFDRVTEVRHELENLHGSTLFVGGEFSPDGSLFAISVTWSGLVLIYETTSWTLHKTLDSSWANFEDFVDGTNWAPTQVRWITNSELLVAAEGDVDPNHDPNGGSLLALIADVANEELHAPSRVGVPSGTFYPTDIQFVDSLKKVVLTFRWGGSGDDVFQVYDYDFIDGTWTFNTTIGDLLTPEEKGGGQGNKLYVIDDRYAWVFYSPYESEAFIFSVIDLLDESIARPEDTRLLYENSGNFWSSAVWSPEEKSFLIGTQNYVAAIDSETLDIQYLAEYSIIEGLDSSASLSHGDYDPVGDRFLFATRDFDALFWTDLTGTEIDIDDWSEFAPQERQTVYLLDVGDYRVPISSAQATMRLNGQSFLQAAIPNAIQHADALASRLNEDMLLRVGFMFEDGSLSPLEVIAKAPFQLSSRSTGPVNDTLQISGYGEETYLFIAHRDLRRVQTRTISADGKRRVRTEIDLFLRPNYIAHDEDGTEFTVGVIQYFINSSGEGMEVIEDG